MSACPLDQEHIRCAVWNLARSRWCEPLWAAVRDMFGVGSARAREVCIWAGLDPDTGEAQPGPAPEQGGRGEDRPKFARCSNNHSPPRGGLASRREHELRRS